MDITTAKAVSDPNVFVPMNESQMATTKGGDDGWPSEEFVQMLLDWIDEQMEDPESVVTQILSNFELGTLDEAIWEQMGNDMADEGLTWPDAQELYDSLFAGGSGSNGI